LARRLAEAPRVVAALPRFADDADDPSPRPAGEAKPPPDRSAPGPEAAREAGAHDDDVAALGLLFGTEQPSVHERQPRGPEVSGRHRVVARARRALRLGRPALYFERAFPPRGSERIRQQEPVRHAGVLDLGPRAQAAGQLLDERGPACRSGVEVARQREPRGERSLDREARVDLEAVHEALDEERGAHEEDEGERELGDDERLPQAASGTAGD